MRSVVGLILVDSRASRSSLLICLALFLYRQLHLRRCARTVQVQSGFGVPSVFLVLSRGYVRPLLSLFCRSDVVSWSIGLLGKL